MGKQTVYVNKKFVFYADDVTENGEAVSQYGSMPIFKGEVRLTDLFGNEMPETKSVLDKNYIQFEVEKEKLKVDKVDMANAYESMDSWLPNEEENETYINGTKDIHSID